MGLSEPWIPSSLSFIWNLITGAGISFESYVIIGNVFIPLTLLFWLIGFTNLVYPEKTNVIRTIYIIVGLAFEVVFLSLLIVNPSLIGVFSAESVMVHIDIEYKTFLLGYLLFVVLTILITGIIFGRKSLKTSDPEIKLKGIFLLGAPIIWSVGALLDTAIPLNIITLPLTRILLALSAFLYYLAFIMPPRIKKMLLK